MDDISYWSDFVSRLFSLNGVFRHSIHIVENDEGPNKQYEIPYAALARYFHTYFESGVKKMQLVMDKAFTEKPLMNDRFCLENPKASLVQWFDGGAHVSQGPGETSPVQQRCGVLTSLDDIGCLDGICSSAL